MPQYMLLIHAPADRFAREETSAPWFAYRQALEDAGALVAGGALQPGETATTLTVRGGETLISDGPFADTKELLAGYFLIDVPDLDAALAWTARMPEIETNTVEVRPLVVHAQAAA